MLNLSRGRLPEAIAHGEAVIASWPEVSHTPVAGRWVSTAVRCLCEALLDRGEAGRARELAVEWSAAVDSEDIEFGMVRFARALVALHDLDVDAAHADFLAYGEICRQVGYEDRTTLWRLGAARAAAGRGDRDEAERLASEALEIALTWGTPGGIGTARHIHALVGDPDLCVAGLEEAIDSLAASPLRLTLAHATIDLGIALRRQGARARARTALADGMELAARCGALGVAERARGELRILGARPRRLMFSGVEALTATERRIAGLAAAGMTNRAIAHDLFVTLKTVETHLGNAYRKLGIRSRAELPAVLGAGDARRPGGPVPTPSSV
jgi:DNA-binding CsgD family transcriptional regulator